MSSEPVKKLLGSTTPRIWTKPLVTGPPGPCGCGCALTAQTSYGFAVERFARDVLKRPLDPWQRWAVIHGGELLPDGRPRFRKLLLIVARQNGKTELLVVLSLFWLYVERRKLVLGTSTVLDYAKESFEKAVALAEDTPRLARMIPAKGGVRRSNGEVTLTTTEKCRYKIAPANRKGGRSLTIHRAILDEIREHHDWSSWGAVIPAMNAVLDAQAWALSNMATDEGVVLLALRKACVAYIKTGVGDSRFGLFEWSAPPGSSPTDAAALAMANPNLNIRIDLDDLLGDAVTAMNADAEALATFQTEVMCLYSSAHVTAIDPEAWRTCMEPGSLDGLRERVTLCIDVAMDGNHATLYAAAVEDDGRVRLDPVRAWTGPGEMGRIEGDLETLVQEIKPRALGWFPNGPAAGIAASLKKVPGAEVEEIRSETTAVCMGFERLVATAGVVHSDDPLLNAHVEGSVRLNQGDAWRFGRKGGGHCDALYAAAGAAHLARTVPMPQQMARTWVV